MKLLVLASVGNPDPATNESPVQLGIVDVPDDAKIDFHSPVALASGDMRDTIAALIVEAKKQLGTQSFAQLVAKAHNSGVTAKELYDFLVSSFSPKHGLEVLAKVINDNPDATAEDGIIALDIALARETDYRLQPGTVSKAKKILAYIRGGNAADFAAVVNKEMPEKWRNNKLSTAEAEKTFSDMATKRDAAVAEQGGPPERRIIPASREVTPEGPSDTLGPKVVKDKPGGATRGPAHATK